MTAARNPILGADRVARWVLGVVQKAPPGLTSTVELVNGLPGIVMRLDGALFGVGSFEVRDGRIHDIYLQVNPQKLRA